MKSFDFSNERVRQSRNTAYKHGIAKTKVSMSEKRLQQEKMDVQNQRRWLNGEKVGEDLGAKFDGPVRQVEELGEESERPVVGSLLVLGDRYEARLLVQSVDVDALVVANVLHRRRTKRGVDLGQPINLAKPKPGYLRRKRKIEWLLQA